MTKKNGHPKFKKDNSSADTDQTPPDTRSEDVDETPAVEHEESSTDSDLTSGQTEVEAAKTLFARASYTDLPAQKEVPEASPAEVNEVDEVTESSTSREEPAFKKVPAFKDVPYAHESRTDHTEADKTKALADSWSTKWAKPAPEAESKASIEEQEPPLKDDTNSSDKSDNLNKLDQAAEVNAKEENAKASEDKKESAAYEPISREALEAAAQYFALQNGQSKNQTPKMSKFTGLSQAGAAESMPMRAESSLDDFTPPDDDGIAKITGSNLNPLPLPSAQLSKQELHAPLKAHDIEAAIRAAHRGESPNNTENSLQAAQMPPAPPGSVAAAPGLSNVAGAVGPSYAQTQVDANALPMSGHQALNDALNQVVNPGPIPSSSGRRTSSEGQPQLVNPFDAHKSGFIDSFRNASKASRNNMAPSAKASRSQMPSQGDGWQVAPGQQAPVPKAPGPKPEDFKKLGPNPLSKQPAKPEANSTASKMPGAAGPQPSVLKRSADSTNNNERSVPFRGRGANEPVTTSPNWPQESEFDRVRAVWAEQVGQIKANHPPRRNSTTVAKNLRTIMTTGICNVREVYSLRGIACLLVFMTQAQIFASHAQPAVPLSTIGAQLFFVMSGFFITRQLVTNETASLWYNLGNHYARRAMRILPMYLVTMAVLLAWGHLPFPESFFSGLFNYKLYELNHNLGALSQYWTMCIELQFYLVFPLLLLVTPRKLRFTLLVGLTGLSVLAGYTSAHTRPNSADYLLLPVCAQFLLIGALVGYIDSATNLALRLNGSKCFLAGITMQIGLQAYLYYTHAKLGLWPEMLWKDWALFGAVSSVLIIFGLWRSANPLLQSLFSSGPLVYMGKISYGFYMLLPVCFILQPSISALDPQIAHVSPIIVDFVLALILAIVAYQYVQCPIMNMRPETPHGKNKYALR